MPITPTYPGVYIEELPSTSHTITPASTSVAAFVGYTHPLKTPQSSATPAPPAPAIQLFSFADYQNNFGGFFDSPWLPDYVGPAVFQFFLNGGATAYVVGLTDPDYVAATATIHSPPDDHVDRPRAGRHPMGRRLGHRHPDASGHQQPADHVSAPTTPPTSSSPTGSRWRPTARWSSATWSARSRPSAIVAVTSAPQVRRRLTRHQGLRLARGRRSAFAYASPRRRYLQLDQSPDDRRSVHRQLPAGQGAARSSTCW